MRHKVAISVAVIGPGLATATYALAKDTGPDGEEACAGQHPCNIVNQLAVDQGESVMSTADEALAEHGRPVGDCPEAQSVYEAADVAVHAVVGPCPSTADATDDVASLVDPTAQANVERALQDLEAGQ